ncbi:hypothetical protein COB47_0171 [Caldicellulosiruptor obsidiansis OB47]|uniref:Binding-protein-dependent transport systems inner membrane component n=1 Tax=Caldicellulosiruptor obsidiansis (strain ATCC BAA-2073 / JCM 16842 / OB47) TaxID=608506 RepID=D9THG8_CALOO|nr:carbohydrate ABC transporter permease [Caldicellulosiruptor obsidiansis]ADL41533.1 hypothetical protein COB47_0171 [Caldicellulosiruptor obsidiansis OB47]
MAKLNAPSHKKINRSVYGNAVIFVILFILGMFTALPLWYTLVSAFKPFDEIFIFPPRLYVRRPTLDNFILMFQLATNMWVPFSRYLFNSLFICVVGTVGHILIASLAAYPLAKHSFAAKKAINEIIVLALLFTPQVTYIPLYIVMSRLHLSQYTFDFLKISFVFFKFRSYKNLFSACYFYYCFILPHED